MVGYVSLEEQVNVDFTRARRKALLGRTRARLRRDAALHWPLCLEEVRKTPPGVVGGIYRGGRTVPLDQIAGSAGRCSEFDRGLLPARANVEERWKRGVWRRLCA